eukprot:scaffold704_cov347-Prasinococcus_capsulatus_cf.AAC.23
MLVLGGGPCCAGVGERIVVIVAPPFRTPRNSSCLAPAGRVAAACRAVARWWPLYGEGRLSWLDSPSRPD